MTRKTENNIADSDKQGTIRQAKVSDINNRIKVANESGADMLISIHMNKFDQTKYYGWQTFYKKNSENSKLLAECIQQGISDNIERENKRESKSISGIKLIDNSKIPSVIVECGFLSNPEDLRLLQNAEYREKIAYGIVDGIEEYYEIKGR
jgi:N-acetylmuramoyl-L-alanine amidase